MLDAAIGHDVQTIVLDIDSPGGQAMGGPELADRIYDIRENSDINIVAVANGMMASAAYLIGSQASIIYASQSSMVGAIGTVMRVDDLTRAEKNMGIDPKVISSHELKGIGKGPITPNQEQALKDMINQHFQLFKDAVSRGRPSLDVETVANGLVHVGAEAVRVGLADEVRNLESVIDLYRQDSDSENFFVDIA